MTEYLLGHLFVGWGQLLILTSVGFSHRAWLAGSSSRWLWVTRAAQRLTVAGVGLAMVGAGLTLWAVS